MLPEPDIETAFVRLMKSAIDMRSLAVCPDQRTAIAKQLFGFLGDADARKAADAMADQMKVYADAIQLALSKGINRADAILAAVEFDRDDARTDLDVMRNAWPANHNAHPINDPSVRASVWALTNGKCAYCDLQIYRDGEAPINQARFVVEHVVPSSMGGPDNLANYVPACMSCNSSKGDRHVLTLIRKMQKRQLELVVENPKMPERLA